MVTSNWINLIAAILVGGGTLTLAVMAWKSIRHTKDIQKSEKREGLLNEIIEWAVDIQKLTLTRDPILATLTGTELIGALHISLENSLSKSEYIKIIAATLDKELKASVENTSSKLECCQKACLDLLTLGAKGPQGDPTFKKFVKFKVDAEKSANEVIKLASNIKILLL